MLGNLKKTVWMGLFLFSLPVFSAEDACRKAINQLSNAEQNQIIQSVFTKDGQSVQYQGLNGLYKWAKLNFGGDWSSVSSALDFVYYFLGSPFMKEQGWENTVEKTIMSELLTQAGTVRKKYQGEKGYNKFVDDFFDGNRDAIYDLVEFDFSGEFPRASFIKQAGWGFLSNKNKIDTPSEETASLVRKLFENPEQFKGPTGLSSYSNEYFNGSPAAALEAVKSVIYDAESRFNWEEASVVAPMMEEYNATAPPTEQIDDLNVFLNYYNLIRQLILVQRPNISFEEYYNIQPIYPVTSGPQIKVRDLDVFAEHYGIYKATGAFSRVDDSHWLPFQGQTGLILYFYKFAWSGSFKSVLTQVREVSRPFGSDDFLLKQLGWTDEMAENLTQQYEQYLEFRDRFRGGSLGIYLNRVGLRRYADEYHNGNRREAYDTVKKTFEDFESLFYPSLGILNRQVRDIYRINNPKGLTFNHIRWEEKFVTRWERRQRIGDRLEQAARSTATRIGGSLLQYAGINKKDSEAEAGSNIRTSAAVVGNNILSTAAAARTAAARGWDQIRGAVSGIGKKDSETSPQPEASDSAAETAAPKTAAPKTATPETGVSETAAPKTAETAAPAPPAPETGVAETAAPAPAPAASETATPATGVSETGVSETAAPKTAETAAPSSETPSEAVDPLAVGDPVREAHRQADVSLNSNRGDSSSAASSGERDAQ